MIPEVEIRKQDGQTGVVRPGSEGICLVLAPTVDGPSIIQTATDADVIEDNNGEGLLTEAGAYQLGAGNPIILLGVTNPSESAEYSALVKEGAGSAVFTAGATDPLDDFDVSIIFPTGGTRGTPGIVYRVSIDGGDNYGPKTKLGTGTNIEIVDTASRPTGITVEIGAGTIATDTEVTFSTKAARMNAGDLADQLEKIRLSDLPWECLHIVGLEADDDAVSALELWFEARELEGDFRFFVVNTRMKGPSESEAAYLAVLDTMSDDLSSIRGVVCADGGDMTSAVRGLRNPRQTSWGLCRRLMSTAVSVDAAEVDLGPIDGFKITADNGDPKFHNEAKSPGLDDLRYTTFRTFKRRDGVFITNPRAISPAGSDYVYAQHIRTMNKACALSFDILEGMLSQGVLKNPSTGFISDADAERIDTTVNDRLNSELVLPKEVSAARFTLSRTDPITSNEGATFTGSVELVGLAYIKKFLIKARFVKTIGG